MGAALSKRAPHSVVAIQRPRNALATMMRSALTGLTAMLVSIAPSSASTIEDQIIAARAAASRCDFDGAVTMGAVTLEQARRAWPAGHEGFFVLYQDLATWTNNRFDPIAAENHARAALDIARATRGENDPLYALAAQNLGVALAGRQRSAEAEPWLSIAARTFRTRGNASGLISAELALSSTEFARGHPAAGAAHAENAATILSQSKAIAGPTAAAALLRIADARRRMLKLGQAEAAVVAARQQMAGRDSKRLLLTSASLAFERGNFGQALDTLDRAEVQAVDPCDPTADADVSYRRGTIHLLRREVSEARFAFGRSADLLETLHLEHSARFAETLGGLAIAANFAGDYKASETLFKRSIAAYRAAFGGVSSAEAQTLMEQAFMQAAAGTPAAAVITAQQATDILRGQVDQQPLDLSYAQATLGKVLKEAGRSAEAEPEILAALNGFTAQRGASSFDLPPGLVTLAEIRIQQRQLGPADKLLQRALAIQQQGGWTGAQAIGVTYARLAQVREDQGRHSDALLESGHAVDVLAERMLLGEQRPWADAEAERRRTREIIEQDMDLTARDVSASTITVSPALIDRVLRSGQLGASLRTGQAIAQMAERVALKADGLGRLVRERQDLIAQWRSLQRDQIASIGVDASDRTATNSPAREREITDRLRAIDKTIDRDHGRAGLVLKSAVVDLAQIQTVVKPDENLAAFFVGSANSYAVIIGKDRVLAYQVPYKRSQLETMVKALRATVDSTGWTSNVPPAFAAGIASALFDKLFKPALPMLAGKRHLIVAADGPLMSIPFGVLLTRPIDEAKLGPGAYRSAPWFLIDHSIEVVPSLAALVALRQLGPSTSRRQSFLGVGDPVLGGTAGSAAATQLLSTSLVKTRMAAPDKLRGLAPLPESGDELRAISRSLGEAGSTLLLGVKARESVVRSMPLEGFNIIAFATHGLIAGELGGYGEPGLVLTPPQKASPQDDGLLSASEVAGLRLDADWVILSACSTAAGDDSPEAEPLTGLAKAFFFAGARSLLVTNWPVESESGKKVSLETIANYKGGMTRAEALRAAQMAMINDNDSSRRTHPVFWASFSVIGVN